MRLLEFLGVLAFFGIFDAAGMSEAEIQAKQQVNLANAMLTVLIVGCAVTAVAIVIPLVF